MPALPCANHPKEKTFVRCGRCDKPICVRCMVDTPVGKKCADCARNRTHITVSEPKYVALAFMVATVAAVPAWFVLGFIPFWISWLIYGTLVGEATLRAGKRRRGLAMQIAAGLAAFLGQLIVMLIQTRNVAGEGLMGLGWMIAGMVIGVAVAVWRVRYM